MQQVLETSDIQDAEFIATEEIPLPSPERVVAETETTRQPNTLLRSILSVFIGPKPEYIPKEYSTLLERPEPSIDHFCRTDPYLYMRTLSG
jgi:hypothetical protein